MEDNRSYDQNSYYGGYDDEPVREAPRRSPRKKKKRSKFARFFKALGKYIAHLPVQTLVIVGGSIAVVLVAVILLIVLLPGSGNKTPDNLLDGQLSITDPTPTPSLAPTDVPTPTPEATPTMDPDPLSGTTIATVGETNDLIPAIQERLVALGYMDMPSGGYTTTFGPATKNAIRRFQLRNFDNYRDVDGQIGSSTYNLLMGDQAKGFWYKKGDTDDKLYVDKIDGVVQTGWVTRLQNRLIELGYMTAGSATGTYGYATVTAVKLFQQYHGLKSDGLAGQTTLEILYTADAMDAVTGALNDKSKLMTPAPDTSTSPDAAATTPGA